MAKRSNDAAGIGVLILGAIGLVWSLIKYPIPTIIGINLLFLIFDPNDFGSVLTISIVVIVIYLLYKKSQKQEVRKREIKSLENKLGTIVTNKNGSLIERSEDIISKHFSSLRNDSWPYYIENKVIECIGDIATAEGNNLVKPRTREYLKDWERRQGVSREWLDLKDNLLARFKARLAELKAKDLAKKEEIKATHDREIARNGEALLEKNKELVDKFLEIAERKVSIIDDYGDENWEILPDEILACLKKISQKEGFALDIQGYLKGKKRGYFSYDARAFPEEYAWLQRKLDVMFREYHEQQKTRPHNAVGIKNLSGVEFETWIAKLLKDNGFDDVRGTPATGDQGADLIAKKNGKTIVIQAKRYAGTVGNKAVQEVIGAVQFYGGDEGWVVTNSSFTPSAKALAQRSSIRLIDGHSLENPSSFSL